jgi:hypothetical protein
MKIILFVTLTFSPFLSLANGYDQTVPYGKNNACEIRSEGGAKYIIATINKNTKKWNLLAGDTTLSKFKSKNYCVSVSDHAKTVTLYNKNNGKTFMSENFHSIEESPDGKFIVIAEKTKSDDISHVNKIIALSEEGLLNLNLTFDDVIAPDDFRMNFSYDGKFLNFYGIKENEIQYNSIDLSKSKLHSNLANNQLTYNRWIIDKEKESFSFTGFYPITDKEYVAKTDLGDIIYVKNNDIAWTVTPQKNVSDSTLLAVGKVYVVAHLPSKGITLLRRTDGQSFNIIDKDDVQLTTDESIFKSTFKSSNVVVFHVINSKTQKMRVMKLNLNSRKLKDFDLSDNCGFDSNC